MCCVAQADKEVHLSIDVRKVSNGSQLEILVQDSGPGVDNICMLKQMFGYGNFRKTDVEAVSSDLFSFDLILLFLL